MITRKEFQELSTDDLLLISVSDHFIDYVVEMNDPGLMEVVLQAYQKGKPELKTFEDAADFIDPIAEQTRGYLISNRGVSQGQIDELVESIPQWEIDSKIAQISENTSKLTRPKSSLGLVVGMIILIGIVIYASNK